MMSSANTLISAVGIKPGERIALIGSGGKTTLMFQIGEEAIALSYSIILTSTTKLGPPPPGSPFPQITLDDLKHFLQIWSKLPWTDKHILLTKGGTAKKLFGIDTEDADMISQWRDVTLMVMEADGSRNLPIKAHASYEPVIPSCTTLAICVLGLHALGRRVKAGSVHRPKLLQQLLNLTPGSILTEKHLRDTIIKPGGYLDQIPSGVRTAVVLNQISNPELYTKSLQIAAGILKCKRFPCLTTILLRGEAVPNSLQAIHTNHSI